MKFQKVKLIILNNIQFFIKLDHFFLEIENLVNLEGFLFDGNNIKTIPCALTKLIKIFHLSFENCSQLTKLPSNILMMPNLLHVSFKGNLSPKSNKKKHLNKKFNFRL